MRVIVTSSLIAIAATMPMAAGATAADMIDDHDIIVTGKTEGYVAIDTSTATKTNTPLIDVPQSINVITRAQIEDQAHHSIADVLRYVPGVTIGQGEGNRDQITMRGQNSTADFYLDGVRDDVQYYRGLYNLERVEILKGPSALIFGRGGGGGVINRVQKTPHVEAPSASARGSVNSFGAHDLSADLNMPLSETAAFRINGVYENLDNHRDYYGGERYAVNPYVAVDLGSGWKAGLSYEYVNDDRVTDRGVTSLNGRPLKGYRDLFFGIPGVNRTTLEAHIAKLRVDGQLASNLSLSTTLLYGDYDKLYVNVFAGSAATAQNGTVTLSNYSDPTERKNFIAQANLVWDVTTGGIAHKILGGVEYGDQDSRNRRFTGTLSPASPFDLANPVYPTITFSPTPTRQTASEAEFFSVYVQDQISIGDHFDVVAGLRYDRFEMEGSDLAASPARAFGRTDDKISPRLGLIYKPREEISLYASYSRSFLPRSGDQFLALTPVQENLDPERFVNREIGLKWNLRPELSLTAALFQLDRKNATTPDPANPANSINIGKTRTKGAEIALTGQLSPQLQISAGYAYQDGTLRGNDSVRLAQLPKHQASFWGRYDFSKLFGAGLGLIHQSSQYAAIRIAPTTTRLPSFTRVDAALFVTPSERLQLQLNVENLFDETYFPDAHSNNNISTGAPINARVTAVVRF